jgi:beta-N-acetylhexosaminidase
LARWTAERRENAGTPATDDARQPIINARQVAASFTLSVRAQAVLASATQPVRWVLIEPEPNVAIGTSPLGPFFDGGAVPSLIVPIDDRSIATESVAEPGVLTVVVGRELHRDEHALAAANAIAARCETLIVDMGFAHSDHVDIATFGASRLVGEALLELLESPA